ncbi:hypothetical protein PPROV_000946300 [Pycnococcus provasolii]|uniref:Serine aminopeptidase S33 domain-containing protein n=2 Tax=Pycnococcus provasolii TaxID=41880 RepID=A0A830HUE3_9CHLO|nr:hypothetical protein PPROV_000946300 [Pycnococcus provasolii]
MSPVVAPLSYVRRGGGGTASAASTAAASAAAGLPFGSSSSSSFKLAVRFAPGSAHSPSVMFLGGLASSMDGIKGTHLANWCAERSLTFLRFDYQGHGHSEGPAFHETTVSTWAGDAEAVFDEYAPKLKRTVLVGSSLGGWLATHLLYARTEQIAGMVGVASAPDFTEHSLRERYDAAKRGGATTPFLTEPGGHFRDDGCFVLPSQYDDNGYILNGNLVDDAVPFCVLTRPPPSNLSPTFPLRFVHGTADVDVPWQRSVALMEHLGVQNSTLRLIQGADHRLSSEQHLNEITAALEEVLAQCGGQ